VSLNDKTLTLRLNFTYPHRISTASEFDFLQVRTNATVLNTLFVDQSGAMFIKDQTLLRYIPQQLGSEAGAIVKTSIVVERSTASIVGVSFAMNFLLSGGLNFFWCMISAL